MANILEYILKISEQGANVWQRHTQASTTLANSIAATGNASQQAANSYVRAMGRMRAALGNFIGGSSLGATAFEYNNIRQSVEGFQQALDTINAPAMQFETAMTELKSITGVSGQALDDITQKSRELAKTFGTDAAKSAGVFTEVLSSLGPEIAKSPQALDAMGRSAMILSKTMQGNVAGATDALTTAMLQYNVSLADPVKASQAMNTQMNIMAQGALVGSAKVEQVAQSITVAGTSAYNSGVGFAEANAAIQVLGKGALYGSEAGTGLRNVLNKIAEGRFLPKDARESLKKAGVDIAKLGDKTIPLAARLNELKKVQADSALITNLFGAENANAANILLSNTDSLTAWTAGMVNTTAAQDQANTNMNTMAEVLARQKARFQDLGIALYGYTKGLLPVLQLTTQSMTLYSQLAPVLGLVKTGFINAFVWVRNFSTGLLLSAWNAAKAGASYLLTALSGVGAFITSLVAATAAQIGLNIAMTANPIGLIIVGLAAVGLAIYGIIAHWDTFKGWLIAFGVFIIKMNPFYHIINYLLDTFPQIKTMFQGLWTWVSGWFDTIFGWLGDLWKSIKEMTGFGADVKITGITQTGGDIPGIGGGGALAPQGAGTSAPKDMTKQNSSVTGGGTKHTNIYITIDKLIETINNHMNGNQDTNGLEDAILNGVTRVLTMAEGAVGS